MPRRRCLRRPRGRPGRELNSVSRGARRALEVEARRALQVAIEVALGRARRHRARGAGPRERRARGRSARRARGTAEHDCLLEAEFERELDVPASVSAAVVRVRGGPAAVSAPPRAPLRSRPVRRCRAAPRWRHRRRRPPRARLPRPRRRRRGHREREVARARERARDARGAGGGSLSRSSRTSAVRPVAENLGAEVTAAAVRRRERERRARAACSRAARAAAAPAGVGEQGGFFRVGVARERARREKSGVARNLGVRLAPYEKTARRPRRRSQAWRDAVFGRKPVARTAARRGRAVSDAAPDAAFRRRFRRRSTPSPTPLPPPLPPPSSSSLDAWLKRSRNGQSMRTSARAARPRVAQAVAAIRRRPRRRLPPRSRSVKPTALETTVS